MDQYFWPRLVPDEVGDQTRCLGRGLPFLIYCNSENKVTVNEGGPRVPGHKGACGCAAGVAVDVRAARSCCTFARECPLLHSQRWTRRSTALSCIQGPRATWSLMSVVRCLARVAGALSAVDKHPRRRTGLLCLEDLCRCPLVPAGGLGRILMCGGC